MEHFVALEKMALKELIKGAFAGFLQTENLTVAYTDMKPGVEIPLHDHPEEAIDIVLDGELEMQIGEKTSLLKKGMISVVPGNVPHRAVAITECRVITIFYPQRKL